jgi:multidrug efflux pump subunit AcrA (membrane-fusion protein)
MVQQYRREALKKLSSPEQLDSLMTVTTPINWLALATMGVLLLSVVLWGIFGKLPVSVEGPGILLKPQALTEVVSLSGGQVVEILVKPGELVPKGTLVARIQPANLFPKTARVDIQSSVAGTVAKVVAQPGAYVQPGDPLIEVTSEVGELEAYLFLPLDKGKKVRPSMKARIDPSTVKADEYGHMIGTVKSVAQYNSSREELVEILGSEDLADAMASGGTYQATPLLVRVRLEQDLNAPSGFKWSSKEGPNFGIREGTVIAGKIVTDTQRPVDMVIPYLDKMLGASD